MCTLLKCVERLWMASLLLREQPVEIGSQEELIVRLREASLPVDVCGLASEHMLL